MKKNNLFFLSIVFDLAKWSEYPFVVNQLSVKKVGGCIERKFFFLLCFLAKEKVFKKCCPWKYTPLDYWMNDVLVRILVRLKSTHYFASSVLIFVQSPYMSVKLYGFTLIEFHSNEAHWRQLGPVLPRALVIFDLWLFGARQPVVWHYFYGLPSHILYFT